MTIARAAALVVIVFLVVVAWAEMRGPKPATSVDIAAAEQRAVKTAKGEPARPATKRAASMQRGLYLDSSLIEGSRFGFLPRIGADGRRPSKVYAARPQAATGRTVGLVIAGFGLRTEPLRLALNTIRTPITFAFTPYGDDLEAQTRKVRERGHETFLLVPTGSATREGRDPGPQAVVASLDSKSRMERLRWGMARFAGYAGALSLTPAKPLDIAGEFARRGVLFLAPDSSFSAPTGKLIVLPAEGFSEERLTKALAALESTPLTAQAKTIVVIPAVPGAISAMTRWMAAGTTEKPRPTIVPVTQILAP